MSSQGDKNNQREHGWHLLENKEGKGVRERESAVCSRTACGDRNARMVKATRAGRETAQQHEAVRWPESQRLPDATTRRGVARYVVHQGLTLISFDDKKRKAERKERKRERGGGERHKVNVRI